MLLNSTKDIKEYSGALNISTSFKTLKPYVRQAEEKYLVPFIGQELYDQLVAGITPMGDGLSTIALVDKAKMLYDLLAVSLANYAYLDALPFLNITVGDNGVKENSGQNFGPVRQWSYYQAQEAAANTGDSFLDQALTFLERNADDFTSWKDSEAFTISKELFIPNVAEISRFINIQQSRRAYLAFKPFIARAEQLYIAPEMGWDLYDDIKEKLVLGQPVTPAETKLILLIRPALAHLALKEAVPELAINITAGGFKVLNENNGIRERLSANEKQLSALYNKSDRLATTYMARLKEHLDTMLQAGEVAPADNQQTWEPPDNSNSESFWV